MACVILPLATKVSYTGTDVFQVIAVAFGVWCVIAAGVTVIVWRGVFSGGRPQASGHAKLGLLLSICLTAMPGFVCALTLEGLSRQLKIDVFYKLDSVAAIGIVRWMCVFQWTLGVMLFLAAYHLYRESQELRA